MDDGDIGVDVCEFEDDVGRQVDGGLQVLPGGGWGRWGEGGDGSGGEDAREGVGEGHAVQGYGEEGGEGRGGGWCGGDGEVLAVF